MTRCVLLLLGSAKAEPSNSAALGTYLLERLRAHGFKDQTLSLHRSVWSDHGRTALLDATDRADLIVLAFPLYVDCPPSWSRRPSS